MWNDASLLEKCAQQQQENKNPNKIGTLLQEK